MKSAEITKVITFLELFKNPHDEVDGLRDEIDQFAWDEEDIK